MAGAWKLIIEDDAGKQIVVPFTRDVITIGRKEGNTIRLTERNVSRNHAKLSKDNGHVVIEDLGSFNGVKLNGDRIDGRVLVHEGDTIQIGDYHLALHAQDGAKTANGHGAHGAPQPAGARSTTAANAPTADDDEFAGDTQRWEPPQGLQGLSVQTLPTQEDRAVQSDDNLDAGLEPTARAPAAMPATLETAPVRLAPGGGFGADNGDTERVSLDMLSNDSLGLDSMKSGAPSMRVRDEVELEPTVRQAASPAPVSVPGISGGDPRTPGPAMPSPLAPPADVVARPSSSAQAISHDRVQADRLPAAAPHVETRPERPAPAEAREAREPRGEPRPGARAPSPSQADARGAMEEQTEAVRPSPGNNADESVPRLVVINTIFAGSSFPIRSAEAVIGRTEDNDITIEHKSVSRNHAKIVREGDRVRILDLKSANGVLVNNEEVEQAVLRSGDVVELGRVRLRFVPIGERFVVPPDEIERARIADRAGDDFENDSGTGVTNPVRKKGPNPFHATSASYDVPAATKPKAVYIALGIVIGLLVVVALILVMKKRDDGPSTDAAPPRTDVVAGDVRNDARADDAVDMRGDDAKSDDAKGDDAKADTKVAAVDAKTGDANDDAASARALDAKADDVDVATDEPDDLSGQVEAVDEKGERRPRPRPKRRVDVEKNLAQAEAWLPQRRFDDVVRLAREVLGAPDATSAQRDKAKKQITTACAFAPSTKGCGR